MTETVLREAFAKQAAICTASGVPFTGRVCGLVGDDRPARGSYLDRAHMARVGAAATLEAPLAWLTYEGEGEGFGPWPVLRLRSWPGSGEAVVLVKGHPHGAWYDWTGA